MTALLKKLWFFFVPVSLEAEYKGFTIVALASALLLIASVVIMLLVPEANVLKTKHLLTILTTVLSVGSMVCCWSYSYRKARSGVPPVAWTPQKGGCSMRPEVRFESGEKTAEGLHA